MTQSSAKRIKTFVDEFIRSEAVQSLQSERNADFINRPDRANRCYEAAEHGADGETHRETINDWRDAFDYMLRDRRAWSDPERFAAGVHAAFDACEEWHEQHGSADLEVG